MDFNKPRVAIYYHVLPSTGMRNDGGPLFVNYNLRKILDGNNDLSKQDGNVLHLWPGQTTKDFGKFDLHVWVDYGEDGLNVPLDWYPPSPSVYWCSDAHLHDKSYTYRMNTAKKFDHVFVAQKEFADRFVADGVRAESIHYLPHAFEPDCYKPHDIINKWDWAFIGHLNSDKRIDLLDRLCKEFPNWYLGWRNSADPSYNSLDDVAFKLSQSKVGVNYCINNDLNMRVFETMGTKTCLLTDEIPDLTDLFIPNFHLLTFKTIDEAVEKMKWALTHDEERQAIAEMGYREVLTKHTYNHRVREILKVALNYTPGGIEDGIVSPVQSPSAV
jgi:glycosyltransferase involved in cell wall biosynthesis